MARAYFTSARATTLVSALIAGTTTTAPADGTNVNFSTLVLKCRGIDRTFLTHAGQRHHQAVISRHQRTLRDLGHIPAVERTWMPSSQRQKGLSHCLLPLEIANDGKKDGDADTGTKRPSAWRSHINLRATAERRTASDHDHWLADANYGYFPNLAWIAG